MSVPPVDPSSMAAGAGGAGALPMPQSGGGAGGGLPGAGGGMPGTNETPAAGPPKRGGQQAASEKMTKPPASATGGGNEQNSSAMVETAEANMEAALEALRGLAGILRDPTGAVAKSKELAKNPAVQAGGGLAISALTEGAVPPQVGSAGIKAYGRK